jgi:serine/threonine-protein kinase PknK
MAERLIALDLDGTMLQRDGRMSDAVRQAVRDVAGAGVHIVVATGRGIGYLLKSRVIDVDEFIDTLERIANGGSVVDPELVMELVTARRRDDPLAVLSVREREVLALMAEGRSNAGIAGRLWVTEGTVEKHVRSILAKLDLPEAGGDHRRVLAVITYLEAR